MGRHFRWRGAVPLGLVLAGTTSAMVAGTTGTLRGTITDAEGGAVEGARVTLTSPNLQGSQSTQTNEDGFYRVFNLPPGIYSIEVVIPGKATLRRDGVKVGIDQTLQVDLGMMSAEGEVGQGGTMVITGESPVINQGSTAVDFNFTREFTGQVAAPRTTTELLALSPGASADAAGTGFRGATSAENNFIIDGINTTNVRNGLPSTALPMEFIEEMQIKTGGYEAEFGKATGAVVNVRTRTGGNEFHGDVWSFLIPYETTRPELTYGDDPDIPGYDNAVRVQPKLGYDIDFGADLGGPIVKDKLWFWVGAQPTLKSFNYTRTIGNETRVYESQTKVAHFASKLSFKPSEYHDISLSFYGNPQARTGAQFTSAAGYARDDDAIYGVIESGAMDGALRYNGRFANDTTNVEVILGYHRESNRSGPEEGNTSQAIIHNYPYTPTDASGAPLQCENVMDDSGQVTGSSDCQIDGGWQTGSVGGFTDAFYQRASAQAQVTHYIDDLMGHHKIKYGADAELNQVNNARGYVGGTLWTSFDPAGGPNTPGEGFEQSLSYAYDVPVGSTCDTGTYTEYVDLYTGETAARCELESFKANTYTSNYAFFLQDTWSIKPNLTLSLGLRWDIQQLRDQSGNIGMGIYDNIAPRLGFIWDPSKEGRSKVFGSYGRFYEAIPVGVNDRSFSQEGIFLGLEDLGGGILFGGENSPVQKGIGGQYSDEIILGVEYEAAKNLSVGAKVIHRQLGDVIEDISFDDGQTYAIANPGQSAEYEILDPVTGEVSGVAQYNDGGDVCTAAYFDEEAGGYGESFEVPCFDAPSRIHNALELTAYKRLSERWQLLGSYVLSTTKGNYPGLFNPENGQLDPNISSQFDIAALLPNRSGFLPQDQRHNLKIHGSYLSELGILAGIGLTTSSGSPYSYLGNDVLHGYGQGEVFMAARGSAGRLPWVTRLDGNLGYVMDLKNDKNLTLTVAAFNLLNLKSPTAVDQNWTFDSAIPVEGASGPSDFQCDGDQDGTFSNSECTQNVNFGQPTAFQTPLRLRLGAKLSF